MNLLIVVAHPEPHSFNGQWARAHGAAFAALGHSVEIDDLCTTGFDPVERAAHYAGDLAGAPFDALKAQENAAQSGSLPADVAAEVKKLQRADALILHFPLWWFAPPAILKGWFERALVHGLLHSVERRFDSGPAIGKCALMCVTTGANELETGPRGKEGDVRLQLWPTAQTLRYCGYSVCEPVLVHGVHGYHEGAAKAELAGRLAQALQAADRLATGFTSRPLIPFNRDTDFDAEGRLRDGAPGHSPFIRHPD